MKAGITIHGDFFENPDDLQRARFIAMNLINALQENNDATVFATCAYLVNRMPGLIEIRASGEKENIKVEFIEEN